MVILNKNLIQIIKLNYLEETKEFEINIYFENNNNHTYIKMNENDFEENWVKKINNTEKFILIN